MVFILIYVAAGIFRRRQVWGDGAFPDRERWLHWWGDARRPHLLEVWTRSPVRTDHKIVPNSSFYGWDDAGEGSHGDAQRISAWALPRYLSPSPQVPPSAVELICQSHEVWDINKSPSFMPIPGKRTPFLFAQILTSWSFMADGPKGFLWSRCCIGWGSWKHWGPQKCWVEDHGSIELRTTGSSRVGQGGVLQLTPKTGTMGGIQEWKRSKTLQFHL